MISPGLFIGICVFAAFIVGTIFGENGIGLGTWKLFKKTKRRNRAARSKIAKAFPTPPAGPKPYDQSEMLRLVCNSSFRPRALLNQTEARLFHVIEDELQKLKPKWRLMAQVNLGEILSTPDKQAFRAINTKRVDMLIINDRDLPVAAFEYQGTGHHLGNESAIRDAVKKEALRRAGVRYIEVQVGDTPAEVRKFLAKMTNDPELENG